MTPSILSRIVASKKEEVLVRKSLVSEQVLRDFSLFSEPCRSIKKSLTTENASGIIAEIKRKSPSKGVFKNLVHVPELARAYQSAGASALSILTDSLFFGGMNEDLQEAKAATTIPVLRKDFIIDPYQIIEAKAIGADVILLIASILSKAQIQEFTDLGHSLGMEVLLEIHTPAEIEKCPAHPDLLGVNNRDLNTFKTDIRNSEDLIRYLPSDVLKISESGINTAQDVHFLRETGFQGFLIGEGFMMMDDPGAACRKLIQGINSKISAL